MALDMIKSKGTLTDKAYEALRDAIVSIELKPGEIILEDDLSEKLGISRTPIRAALQRLSYEGLVGMQGKKTFVTELSADYFLDLYAIRESLEILSAKLAAANRSDKDLSELKRITEKHEEVTQQQPMDRREYLDIDRKYHMFLAKLTKNQMLEEYIRQIYMSYNRYLNYTNFEGRAMTVIREHEDIYNAISERDSIRAQSLMKEHLAGVKESILINLVKSGRR
ncbi:MAG: GntR family transcriptional regulator [Gudongella sp.]|nr:GntR family transcriptional regulator [Gudongella sp.]